MAKSNVTIYQTKAKAKTGLTVTKKKLSQIFGVTVRQVARFIADGMPACDVSARAHKYDTAQCVEWLRQHERDKATSAKTDRQRQDHFKANLLELEYRKEAGELVPIPVLTGILADLVLATKDRIESIPARLTQVVPAASDPTIQQAIRDEIGSILGTLAADFARYAEEFGGPVEAETEPNGQ